MNQKLNEAKPILNKLINAGYEAYFVGGCVRDTLMNNEINDIDITTDATPDEIETVFDHTLHVGKEFGTVIVIDNDNQYEITTFRTENESLDGRHPAEVKFVKNLHEDLSRRDFTMNAIAMNVNGKLIDPFNGQNDIKKGVIKTVGDAKRRFNEDYLRMLRALRFVAKYNFVLDQNAYNALVEDFILVNSISKERIINELTKLLNLQHVGNAMQLLNQLSQSNKQLLNLNLSHIEINRPISIELFLAILLQFQTVNLVELKLSNKQKTKIIEYDQIIKKLSNCEDFMMFKYIIYQFDINLIKEVLNYADLLKHNNIHIVKCNINRVNSIYNRLTIHSSKDLCISGRDLVQYHNRKAGPWVGKMLKYIEKLVVTNQINNNIDDCLVISNYLN